MKEQMSILEGEKLDDFLEYVAHITKHRNRIGRVRVWVDEGHVKVKIDGGVWTPPMGRPAESGR